MIQQLAPAFRLTVLLTVITGFVYPGVVTGLSQILFRGQANGSLVTRNGHVIGSALLAQSFTRPQYFHARSSAAGPDGYDPTASGGSNLGPTSQKLIDRMTKAAAQFRAENPDFKGEIPVDAVTASGSGLDPEISLENARAQAARVAKARGIAEGQVGQLMARLTEGRALGLFGEPRVNVLKLNLALDAVKR